jgi:organic radical activating enzyme
MKYQNLNLVKAGIKNFNIKTFSWHLVDVCNQSCTYCNEGFGSDIYRPKSTFFKDTRQSESYKLVLKRLKLKSLGKFEVDLLGGEPTLHSNLFEIIENLNSINNCIEISLITNLKKNFSYYEKFSNIKYNKLLLCPSIHMEYYNDELLEKIIKLNKLKHFKILPIIMIHDDKKYYSPIKKLLDTLLEKNIEFTVSFLFDACGFTVNYDDKFLEEMNAYADKDENRYIFETDEGKKLNLNKHSIYNENVTNFEGWKCTPLRYKINHFGGIFNVCSNKPLPLTGKSECIECPHTSCLCDIQWKYDKEKYERP